MDTPSDNEQTLVREILKRETAGHRNNVEPFSDPLEGLQFFPRVSRRSFRHGTRETIPLDN